MEPIFDFSAAPHLPYSLRQTEDGQRRPDVALSSLLNAGDDGDVVILARGGEIYIAFAEPAAASFAGDQVNPLVFG